MARHMQIQLQEEQVNSLIIGHLKSILTQNEQGMCGLGFEYQGINGACQLDVVNDWRVVPNKHMLEQLETLIGRENFRLIY